MKKIAIITSSRADYGLLEPLIKLLSKHKNVCLIVSGTHLSCEHGYTKNDINFPISDELEIVMSHDTPNSICKSFGLAVDGFSEIFNRQKPDGVLLLGDRYEMLACAIASHINNIKIIHLHGGEISGNYDNAFRHSITQLSTYHFPATYKAFWRIVKFKGDTLNIHMIGALGCDGLVKRTEKPDNKILISWHPETSNEKDIDYDLMKEIYIRYPNTEKLQIMPNADNGRYRICVQDMSNMGCSFETLPRKDYIEYLSKCRMIIGNSSSGIIESPALGIPSIQVGDRQQNRERAASIIDCEPNQESIKQALTKLESKTFQDLMKTDYYCPYRGENVANKIVEVLNRI